MCEKRGAVARERGNRDAKKKRYTKSVQGRESPSPADYIGSLVSDRNPAGTQTFSKRLYNVYDYV